MMPGRGSLFTLPDPCLNVSECLLASMELGIKSASWAMVKNELSANKYQ